MSEALLVNQVKIQSVQSHLSRFKSTAVQSVVLHLGPKFGLYLLRSVFDGGGALFTPFLIRCCLKEEVSLDWSRDVISSETINA